ncbi:FAD-dependent oxidoreductase [Streptomyces gamaensis]|uniref:D-amino-acid oxidase n=1 Tax=Streptomyces gamaensis TaxID=1763542 RepID=A0ABW0Z971_9ACTN
MSVTGGIVVVGAGVAGLTTAVVLAEAGHEVRLVAEELPGRTSLAAGAVWGPFLVGPQDRVERWGRHSLGVLTALAAEPATGVRLVTGTDAARRPVTVPHWAAALPGFTLCDATRLPQGFVSGYRMTAPLVDMPVHLDYLQRRFLHAGGSVERRRVGALREAGPGAAAVVNCAGLGARELARDATLRPVRGQTVVVENPGITEFFCEVDGDDTELLCVFPHGDTVVLGGVAVDGDESTEPDEKTAEGILARCAAVVPALARARVLGHRAGIRPVREQVRLEAETADDGTLVVHNYGHGGAGVTLAWGCAREAAGLCAGR